MNKKINIINHPFVADCLAHLRDKNTQIAKFRRQSDQICQLLFTEAIRGLELRKVEIETPIEKASAEKLLDEVVIIPILRAGLAMLFGAMQLLPKSKIGFAGLKRDEQTAIAYEYYWNIPNITQNSVIIITDPMLATGGSAVHVIEKIAKLNPKKIKLVSVIAAPEGVDEVLGKFPEVEIFTAAVDEKLNDKKYIVPGLGDFGDRYFGTD